MNNLILVVDDQKDITDGVKTSQGMAGYRVISAKNDKDALDVLDHITPDLILADIMMPQMDGYELYKRVNQDDRFVQNPFIIVTAKTAQEDIRKGKFMGVDDDLTKPFDPAQQNKVIRRGSANAVKKWATTFEGNQVPPGFNQEVIGFRCVR